jgi:arsenate reductase-like glutaredoxin family protein
VTETVDCNKVKFDAAAALKLLDGMQKLVAAKGKKIVEFNLKGERPTDEELIAVMIGPTGNLRAPTAKIGKTLLIGFNDEAYRTVLAVDS